MAKDFNSKVGSKISKGEALKWIKKFDKERRKDTKSVFYGREAILNILNDPTVCGISFFFARKTEDGVDRDDIIMIGTREDGTLAWKSGGPAGALGKDGDDDESAYDMGRPCPPYCPELEQA